MKKITANNFSEFDDVVNSVNPSTLCRGVSNSDYELIPSLFRHHEVDKVEKRENHLMWLFKSYGKAYLRSIPTSEVEWLVIAQHHGLPTRLLDWSLSPLVACYFAVHDPHDENDGAIYFYDAPLFVKEENIVVSKMKSIESFVPSHATKRVTSQSGMFTIHPTESHTLVDDKIIKLTIPSELKDEFRKKLSKYGIHHATMFPDLDGLSKYIKVLQGYNA